MGVPRTFRKNVVCTVIKFMLSNLKLISFLFFFSSAFQVVFDCETKW